LRHPDTNWQALISLGYECITPINGYDGEPRQNNIFLVMGLNA
jgi:hypothetical protein